MRRRALLLVLASLVLIPACGSDDGTPEVWIYTSLYPHVIEDMKPLLANRFPDVRFRWYQKGSEQIAVRLNVELEAGRTECDLLVTSDPFYYAELKERGELLAYETDMTADVPAGLKDPEHTFCTVRIPVMVMGVRKDLMEHARPPGFTNLTSDTLDGMVTMGDPLKSGTNFTTVAALSTRYGWEYFETLAKRKILSAGGNSAVLRRLESGERHVGIVLLENLLSRKDVEGNPVEILFPNDGAIPVPSPIAIMKRSKEPEVAKQVLDFFFTRAMQRAIVKGNMYSPLPNAEAPEGAPAWSDLQLYPWTNEFLHDVKARRDAIKERWRAVMR